MDNDKLHKHFVSTENSFGLKKRVTITTRSLFEEGIGIGQTEAIHAVCNYRKPFLFFVSAIQVHPEIPETEQKK